MPHGTARAPHNPLVVLAEDDGIILRIVSTVLIEAGMRVEAFLDSAEAHRCFEHRWQQVDLLLTDLVMPHMSGLDLVHAACAEHPDMAVLIISGTQDLAATVAPYEALSKPFSKEALLAKVQDLLA